MKSPLVKLAVTTLSLTAALGMVSLSAEAHDNATTVVSVDTTNTAVPNTTDANAVGKAANTPNIAGNEQGNDNKRGMNPNRNADKIAQNQAAEEARRAIFANRMREMLTKAGFPEVATQDAIIAFLASEEAAKEPLRTSTRRLAGSLKRDAPPERVRDLLAEYKTATETEKTRKEAARAALDAKISYSKNPRLEAILLISGILGDGNGFRYEMLMQRPGQGQGGGFNGQQNGALRGQGNPNGDPNQNGNQPRPYPGGRDRTDRGGVEAPAPEIKAEPAAQPATN